MVDVTNEQAAYMAAAIDGEGHIGLQRDSPSAQKGRISPTFQFRVRLTNTNRSWLETLQTQFGGTLIRMHSETERKRACYELRFAKDEARAMLLRIQPYLIIKQQHVGLMLRYFELASKRRLFSKNATPTNPAIIAEQDAIYAAFKSANLSRKVPPRIADRSARRCTAPDCERQHYGKGYCWRHYRLFIIRGGPSSYERSCEVCGTEFVTKRVDTKCCSRKCTDRRFYLANAEQIKAAEAARRALRRSQLASG